MQLFGTDGVRGTAGQYPLDAATVRRIGAALVRALPHGTESPRLLVGRDTRESGGWIEAELAHGAAGEGASVTSAGVVPTPAVAYLTRTGSYDAGVVISASHNPFEDNGIKVFSGRGEKFTERVEREVEAIVADPSWQARPGEAVPLPTHGARRTVSRSPARGAGGSCGARRAENRHRLRATERPRRSRRSCSDRSGSIPSSSAITPTAAISICGCGSTHPERLAQLVVEKECALGVAFDGDGDRAIFVDAAGQIVDGDAVLLMCARQLQREGRLKGGAIVATVMSNIGLQLALAESGIGLVRCSGRRQVRDGGDARPRPVARRRTVRGTSFSRITSSPAMASARR